MRRAYAIVAAALAVPMLLSGCLTQGKARVARRFESLGPDLYGSPWAHIAHVGSGRSRRASSWDKSGGNWDALTIQPGETVTLADIEGPGMITHLYFTMVHPHLLDYREAVLRMYWDGEETPSVEAPLGDFFCVGNCVVRRFASEMVTVNLGGNRHTYNNGFNCYWPMPFSKRARITLENESPRVLGGQFRGIWTHIDYIQYDEGEDLPEHVGRFHAQWRRENPTTVSESVKAAIANRQPSLNLTGDENYVMLEAEGKGQVVGLFLQVNNFEGGWYGEGDDMVFIDGATWPPSIHGTGTEEVFGGGACPDAEYTGPYTGFLLVENKDGEAFKGLNAMYRWYLHDPLRFQERIRLTIEHSHNNDLANDYSSVVYWYQQEPHAPFPELPPAAGRWPAFGPAFERAHVASMELLELVVAYVERLRAEKRDGPKWLGELGRLSFQGYEYMQTRQFDKAQETYERMLTTFKEKAAVDADGELPIEDPR